MRGFKLRKVKPFQRNHGGNSTINYYLCNKSTKVTISQM
ncbi:hypothetical protein Patl1_14139 [Pistacia atlantica]|uniref:Uncharacterized protein n=1 Tax=Pistacia atlantica TaxID=434234 RepID=A0ACC1AVL0_9ROSI|nr:hypothetical protein Patl1_14139 [Pistacia atlantica]